MKKYVAWQWISVSVLLFIFTASAAYGHGEGGGSSVDLTEISFTPNPSVPEFTNAKGTALINLTEGVIQLEDLEGFPFDSARSRISGQRHLNRRSSAQRARRRTWWNQL